ncbi:caspase domain [Desulfoluna spongiiphila]|nr:caspase domain [Desulfoluna spongiiphila]
MYRQKSPDMFRVVQKEAAGADTIKKKRGGPLTWLWAQRANANRLESPVKRVLPALVVLFLFSACTQKRFAFEYEGEPVAAPRETAAAVCRIHVVPEGAGQPGFRVTAARHVPERVAKTRVEARGVTRWEIHGYEPDAQLILGGALSTVAGVVVTPVWCIKRLFSGWGDPEGEEAMRQRVFDSHLRSWLFMGYLWAPVDYEVLDRSRVYRDTGTRREEDGSDAVRVTVLDDQGRRVETTAFGGGHYRPDVTDTLLESRSLYISASCDGGADALSLDLLPWYRQRYDLTPKEASAFERLLPQQRPYLLTLPPELRADFLALSRQEQARFTEQLPLPAIGDRGAVEAALKTAAKGRPNSAASFEDDLPALLKASRPVQKKSRNWLFAMGIEAYDQTGPITYSRRSAELFTRVAMKRLGVPPENVFLLTDDGLSEIPGLASRTFPATAASIKDQFRFLLREVAEGDRIYLYYSGHGLPSLTEGGAPYLLARDQAPDFIHTDSFFRVDALLESLARSRASETVVFLDSCFTGAADGSSAFGDSRAATRLVPKRIEIDDGRMAVLTAGTERQFSNMYPEKGHRLFSYFLMKELCHTHHTLESLFERVHDQTRRVSRARGGTQLQEPTLRGTGRLTLSVK